MPDHKYKQISTSDVKADSGSLRYDTAKLDGIAREFTRLSMVFTHYEMHNEQEKLNDFRTAWKYVADDLQKHNPDPVLLATARLIEGYITDAARMQKSPYKKKDNINNLTAAPYVECFNKVHRLMEIECLKTEPEVSGLNNAEKENLSKKLLENTAFDKLVTSQEKEADYNPSAGTLLLPNSTESRSRIIPPKLFSTEVIDAAVYEIKGDSLSISGMSTDTLSLRSRKSSMNEEGDPQFAQNLRSVDPGTISERSNTARVINALTHTAPTFLASLAAGAVATAAAPLTGGVSIAAGAVMAAAGIAAAVAEQQDKANIQKEFLLLYEYNMYKDATRKNLEILKERFPAEVAKHFNSEENFVPVSMVYAPEFNEVKPGEHVRSTAGANNAAKIFIGAATHTIGSGTAIPALGLGAATVRHFNNKAAQKSETKIIDALKSDILEMHKDTPYYQNLDELQNLIKQQKIRLHAAQTLVKDQSLSTDNFSSKLADINRDGLDNVIVAQSEINQLEILKKVLNPTNSPDPQKLLNTLNNKVDQIKKKVNPPGALRSLSESHIEEIEDAGRTLLNASNQNPSESFTPPVRPGKNKESFRK